MKNRVIFNRIKKHLLRQNKKSQDEVGCLYRCGKLSCSVGCLISPKNYNPSIEGQSINDSAVKTAVRKSLGIKRFNPSVIDMLRELQVIHDDSEVESWAKELNDFERNNTKLLERSAGTKISK